MNPESKSSKLQNLKLVLVIMSAIGLIGCGGGSSSTPAPAPPPDPSPLPIDPLAPAAQIDLAAANATYAIESAGTGGDAGGDGGAAGSAGDGAPIKNAVVTLTDAKGNVVTGRTDSNGQYLLKFKTAVFSSPLVMRVVDAGNNVLASVTDEVTASGKVIRINVNPLTDKITSDTLVGSVAGTDKNFDGSQVDKTKLAKAKADLVTSINAALGVAGISNTTNFDPIKSIYNYDGTGVDAVIESLSHARDPSSGATQLRVKLATTAVNAEGLIAPALVTAGTPLPGASVAIPSSSALTFTKLSSWIAEINRCLAKTGAALNADTDCLDNDGSRLVSSTYLTNSRTFEEDFRTLFSEPPSATSAHVQGSTFANPVVLFFARYPNSTIDDLAVVEVTVRQPRTGPRAGSLVAPIEYTKFIVFRRDDSLTRSKAGNWIAHGNQRNYDVGINARYYKFAQVNTLKQANVSGSSPGTIFSDLHVFINPSRYDKVSDTYVSANLRAVRVTGPGLPAAGLVLANSTVSGAIGYLTIHNKTGAISTTPMSSSIATNSFRLSGTTDTGAALYAGFWPTSPGTAGVSNGQTYADVMVTDFTKLQAYNQYRFEYFLNTNQGNTTPDAVETARILAPLTLPTSVLGLPLSDLSPSLALVTPPAAAACTFDVVWTNNPNGAPINALYIYGEDRSPKNALSNSTFVLNKATINANPVDAFLVSNRPRSATLTNCNAPLIPSLSNTVGGGDFRELAIRSTLGRAQIYNGLRWSN
jgi:hypothetical protein